MKPPPNPSSTFGDLDLSPPDSKLDRFVPFSRGPLVPFGTEISS